MTDRSYSHSRDGPTDKVDTRSFVRVPNIFCHYPFWRSRNAAPPYRPGRTKTKQLCVIDRDKKTKRGKVRLEWPMEKPDPQVPDGYDMDLLLRLYEFGLRVHRNKAHAMALEAGKSAGGRRNSKRQLRREIINDAKAKGMSVETEISEFPNMDEHAEAYAMSGAYRSAMKRIMKNPMDLGEARIEFRSAAALCKAIDRNTSNPTYRASLHRSLRIWSHTSILFRQWPAGRDGFRERHFDPFLKYEVRGDGSLLITLSIEFMDLCARRWNAVPLPLPCQSHAALAMLFWIAAWKDRDSYRRLETLASKLGVVANSSRRHLKHGLGQVVHLLRHHDKELRYRLQFKKGLVRLQHEPHKQTAKETNAERWKRMKEECDAS